MLIAPERNVIKADKTRRKGFLIFFFQHTQKKGEHTVFIIFFFLPHFNPPSRLSVEREKRENQIEEMNRKNWEKIVFSHEFGFDLYSPFLFSLFLFRSFFPPQLQLPLPYFGGEISIKWKCQKEEERTATMRENETNEVRDRRIIYLFSITFFLIFRYVGVGLGVVEYATISSLTPSL